MDASMLVSVAILSISGSFLAIMSPTGGIMQLQDLKAKSQNQSLPLEPGQAIHVDGLQCYLQYHIVTFFSSIAVVLLFICLLPWKNFLIAITAVILWVSIFCTGSAFVQIIVVYDPNFSSSVPAFTWYWSTKILMVMLCIKLMMHIWEKICEIKDTYFGRYRLEDDVEIKDTH